MVDTDPDGLLADLRLLSKRELQVLDLRCQGMKYAKIGRQLSIAVPTVKTDMGRVYMKLGLDVIEPSQRLKTLYDTVCPLLELIKSEMRKAKAGTVEKTPAPEVVDGEVIPEKEAPIPPKVKDMVEEDEKAMVPLRPAPLVAPSSSSSAAVVARDTGRRCSPRYMPGRSCGLSFPARFGRAVRCCPPSDAYGHASCSNRSGTRARATRGPHGHCQPHSPTQFHAFANQHALPHQYPQTQHCSALYG